MTISHEGELTKIFKTIILNTYIQILQKKKDKSTFNVTLTNSPLKFYVQHLKKIDGGLNTKQKGETGTYLLGE